MIKQFNFYDIYGYLLPGIAFLGLMWVPIGIISKSWPDQDISKALFLAALAYFLGHLLQTIATNAVPSQVMRDEENRRRYPSDRLLDPSCGDLSTDLKNRLLQQVREKFGLDLHVGQDYDGTNAIISDRSAAFFQARSYLIAKKTAHYVEQFEGMYAMMRGLACALLAGSCYLAGWALAFYRASGFFRLVTATLGVIGVSVALVSSFVALSRSSGRMKQAVVTLAIALLVIFWAAGFWAAAWQPATLWNGASRRIELVLWLATSLSLIAAVRCFSSYRSFAILFAQSVWRDFSVYLSMETAAAGHAEETRDQDADDNEDD